MDSKNNDYKEPKSTPKLSLNSLPRKPPEPLGLLTPPLHTSASIPFQWEEVPGKPRTTVISTPPCKSKVARSLDLPPRLATTEISNMASPTTVLDGHEFLSKTASFGSPVAVGSFRSVDEISTGGKVVRERVRFSSWRWVATHPGKISKSDFHFSSNYNNINVSHHHSADLNIIKKKMSTRKASFFSFSHSHGGNSTNFLGNIYESIKKVVPWINRRRGKSRNMSF